MNKCVDMEEKGKNSIIDNYTKKLDWEAPKLISLDKGKTEGGPETWDWEDISYSKPDS